MPHRADCRPKEQLGQHGRAHLRVCGVREPATLTCLDRAGVVISTLSPLVRVFGSVHVNKVFYSLGQRDFKSDLSCVLLLKLWHKQWV